MVSPTSSDITFSLKVPNGGAPLSQPAFFFRSSFKISPLFHVVFVSLFSFFFVFGDPSALFVCFGGNRILRPECHVCLRREGKHKINKKTKKKHGTRNRGGPFRTSEDSKKTRLQAPNKGAVAETIKWRGKKKQQRKRRKKIWR